MISTNHVSLASLAVLIGCSAPAQADVKLPQVMVSSNGADVSQCGFQASFACATLQYAYDNVVGVGGEIQIISPGTYAGLTINSSVQLLNKSGEPVVIQGDGSRLDYGRGVISMSGAWPDNFFLRIQGIKIDGRGHGIGLNVQNRGALVGGTLIVQNCEITNADVGVMILTRTGSPNINIIDSNIHDNNSNGLFAQSAGTDMRLNVVSSTIQHNGYDISALGTYITVGSGIYLFAGSDILNTINAQIYNSRVYNNNNGIVAHTYDVSDAPYSGMMQAHIGSSTIYKSRSTKSGFMNKRLRASCA